MSRRAVETDEASYYEQSDLWGHENRENEDALRQRYEAIDRLLPSDVRTVIDVGSGDGRVLEYLREHRPGLGVYATDRSFAALTENAAPSVRASATTLPVRPSSVDAALCCEVLEHLDGPTFDSTRRELARVARSHVLITVPNRENLRRAEIRCPQCRCAYNPMRHLRSFSRDDMIDLVPGFRLATISEAGPRAVIYPRLLRVALESIGVLHRSGSPACPQCGSSYQADGALVVPASPTKKLKTTDPRFRTIAPKSKRRYWLCALYTRLP